MYESNGVPVKKDETTERGWLV